MKKLFLAIILVLTLSQTICAGNDDIVLFEDKGGNKDLVINKIPPELWQKIFSYIKTKENKNKLTLTCRAMGQKFFQSLKAVSFDIAGVGGLKGLNEVYKKNVKLKKIISFQNVQKLKFQKVLELKNLGNIMPLFPNVLFLDLSGCTGDFSVLSKLVRLKELNVFGGDFNNLSLISGLTDLEVLYLPQDKEMSDLSKIEKLTKLIELDLYVFPQDSSVLEKFQNLEVLSLPTFKGQEHWSFLSKLRKLKKLYIRLSKDEVPMDPLFLCPSDRFYNITMSYEDQEFVKQIVPKNCEVNFSF